MPMLVTRRDKTVNQVLLQSVMFDSIQKFLLLVFMFLYTKWARANMSWPNMFYDYSVSVDRLTTVQCRSNSVLYAGIKNLE